jgi:hypothetical protein
MRNFVTSMVNKNLIQSQIMALIWALMMKYMRFDDDEDSQENLQAKDALLKWLQFHTSNYKCVQIANLTKSFHNGLAFTALIHKFKPDLVPNPDSMDPTQGLANLKLAMNAAEKFFGLEQYLEPKDVAKLDEKSALVYVSEYYYGVNEQAKRVLAAKRISKLIAFTTVNDQLREKYASNAAKLLTHLTSAEGLLQNISAVDNTLAGARKRVDDFNRYKTVEKGPITSLEIELEETLNTLGLRLQQNNRPAFQPANAETRLDTLRSRIKAIFGKETVEPALHAELNRQVRLVQLNKRHASLSEKLQVFIREKEAYVKAPVSVSSSGEARKQLRLFAAFVKVSIAPLDQACFSSFLFFSRSALLPTRTLSPVSVTWVQSCLARSSSTLPRLPSGRRPWPTALARSRPSGSRSSLCLRIIFSMTNGYLKY